MFLILLLPIVFAILLSFTDANLLKMTSSNFVGLQNYVTFFKSGSLGKVVNATIFFVIGGVFFMYVFGLFFALMIHRCRRMNFLFRTLTILPIAIPEVVLVLIWRLMLHPQYGVINYMFHAIGLLPDNFSWFSSGKDAVIALLMISVWKVYPLAFLMLFAGLKGIPDTLYEAAAIDGAGPVRRFWAITMPGLRYVTSSLLLLITIWQLRSFTIIWLSTKGGPADATAMLTIFSYLNAFNFNKLGYGSAIGFLVVLICLAVAFFYYLLIIRKLGDE